MAKNKYGSEHQAMRSKYARLLNKDGILVCYRCHRPIYRDQSDAPTGTHVPRCRNIGCEGQCWTRWDLGHTDDGSTWHGPEHSCCNRQAGGHNSAIRTNQLHQQQRTMTVREW